MTFTLISCVYACGVAKPGHGSHTPLVVGLALFCCAASGGQYTGGALNPARVLGPLTVFGCGEDIVSWRKTEMKRLRKEKKGLVTSEVDQNLMYNILHPSVGSFLRSPIFPPCACNTSLSLGIVIHNPVSRKHKLTSQKLLTVSFVFLHCFRFTDTSLASFLPLCLPCVFLPLCLAWGHWTRGLHVLPWTSPSQRWEIGQNLVHSRAMSVRGCWKTHDLLLACLRCGERSLTRYCSRFATCGSRVHHLRACRRLAGRTSTTLWASSRNSILKTTMRTCGLEETAKVWGNNCWKGRVKDQETFITGSV